MAEEGTAAVDMTGAADAAEATPAADAVEFDWSQPLPDDAFPETMREQMKGKSLGAVIGDGQKMRQAASQLGEKNKALEAQIAELKKKPAADKAATADLSEDEISDLLRDRIQQDMVSGPDYKEVQDRYFETGEISEEFLDVVEKNGVMVTRRDVQKFMAYMKEDRDAKIGQIDASAEGAVAGEELYAWLNSDQCPFSKEIRVGFEEQSEKGNYGWVELAVKEYQDWSGDGRKTVSSSKNRFTQGPMQRGRPVRVAQDQDLSAEEFSKQWRELTNKQSTQQITKAEEIKEKAILTKRRRATAD